MSPAGCADNGSTRGRGSVVRVPDQIHAWYGLLPRPGPGKHELVQIRPTQLSAEEGTGPVWGPGPSASGQRVRPAFGGPSTGAGRASAPLWRPRAGRQVRSHIVRGRALNLIVGVRPLSTRGFGRSSSRPRAVAGTNSSCLCRAQDLFPWPARYTFLVRTEDEPGPRSFPLHGGGGVGRGGHGARPGGRGGHRPRQGSPTSPRPRRSHVSAFPYSPGRELTPSKVRKLVQRMVLDVGMTRPP